MPSRSRHRRLRHGTASGDNEATWCDIFPNVAPDVYREKVVDIFKRFAKEMGGEDCPLKVINDGEVTALAAVQKIKKGNVMGISMGSSEGGYANADGNLMGWINELCYLRLDLNPDAPTDPWTKGNHTEISYMYLGQRAPTRLAVKTGSNSSRTTNITRICAPSNTRPMRSASSWSKRD